MRHFQNGQLAARLYPQGHIPLRLGWLPQPWSFFQFLQFPVDVVGAVGDAVRRGGEGEVFELGSQYFVGAHAGAEAEPFLRAVADAEVGGGDEDVVRLLFGERVSFLDELVGDVLVFRGGDALHGVGGDDAVCDGGFEYLVEGGAHLLA